jgi:hypothetical protein
MNGQSLKDFPIFALGSFRNFHVYRPAHASSVKGEMVSGKHLKQKYWSQLPVRLAPERTFWLASPAWTFNGFSSYHRNYSDTFPEICMCPGNIIVTFLDYPDDK